MSLKEKKPARKRAAKKTTKPAAKKEPLSVQDLHSELIGIAEKYQHIPAFKLDVRGGKLRVSTGSMVTSKAMGS